MDMRTRRAETGETTPAEGQNHEHVVKSAAQPFNEISKRRNDAGEDTAQKQGRDNDYQCAA